MAISANLHRKLRQALGADAGDDLVTLLEVVEATRRELAELRHEMQLGFARVDERIAGMESRLSAQFDAALQKGLKDQTRFFFLAWSVVLASIVGLYAR
jgi:hypothetical protein